MEPKLSDPNSLVRMNELQVETARRMVASAGGAAWTELHLRMFAIGPQAQSVLWLTGPDGDRKGIRDTADADEPLNDLRDLMGRGPSGAWFTADAVLGRDGEITFEFDYQTEPAWDVPPEPEEYLRDIAAYPRPADQIPNWHPAHEAR